ncbi:hypothetical protein JKP88DRAFT_349348 [Tribonema minus]|uniref:Uncharacterized protein n=1 Tax=Tribonema minus TaxID=303371 RepID=A0A835YSZ7_9STRA|nr:hypothetical protein JKP88DRAFT_349348 [Tribonema minus]
MGDAPGGDRDRNSAAAATGAEALHGARSPFTAGGAGGGLRNSGAAAAGAEAMPGARQRAPEFEAVDRAREQVRTARRAFISARAEIDGLRALLLAAEERFVAAWSATLRAEHALGSRRNEALAFELLFRRAFIAEALREEARADTPEADQLATTPLTPRKLRIPPIRAAGDPTVPAPGAASDDDEGGPPPKKRHSMPVVGGRWSPRAGGDGAQALCPLA